MNKTFSALGGLLVILVAVVFIVQFRPASGTQGGAVGGPTCAIEIQGGCITTSDYNAAFRLIGGGFDNTFLKSIGARRIVADGLIERHLLNEDAKRLGITVSDEDITAELGKGRAYVSLPADKEREMAYYLGLLAPQSRRIVWDTPFRVLAVKNPKTKTFDVKTYDKTIRAITKLSPADFREFQRQEMIAARMRDLIKSRVHVSEAEGYEDYARRKSTATLDYVELDRNFFADLFVDQSQKAIDEWAAKNADEINKTYEAKKSQLEGECRVARHILAKVREDASDEDKAKAKKRIDKALELVNKGEDFAAVATRLSEDGSATKGGALGCIAKKQTVEAFEKALWALEEGKISPIVTSEFGHHIIKLEKIAKGETMDKVVKDLIARDLYLKHAAETMAAEGAKKIHAAVKGGKPLADALKTYLEELSPPAKDEKKPAEDTDAKKDDKPADDVVENKPFTADNHPDRPLVQSSAPFNVTGNPLPDAVSTTELVKEAFKLKPGETTGDVVPLRSGYAIVTLKEKTPVKKEEWDKDREETLSAMRTTKQAEALTLYVQRLRSKAMAESPIKENTAITNPPEEKTDDVPTDEGEP